MDELIAYGRKNGDRIAYTDALERYGRMGFREVSRKEKDAGEGHVFTEVELTRVM